MTDKRIKPDIFSYNTLINGYCKKKNLDEAMNLFLEISRNGSKPDIVTYNTILQGLLEVGGTGSVQNYLLRCYLLVTNLIYALLSGYFHNGLVENAMLLFYKLERRREDRDIKLYSIVIDGLCKNGELYKAHAIFEKLPLIGLLSTVITYNIMINGFCREGLVDEAKNMLRKMEDHGYSPNNATYNVMVRGFLKCSKIGEMAIFLKGMTGRCEDFSFDATTIELLIDVTRKDPSLLDIIPQFHLGSKK